MNDDGARCVVDGCRREAAAHISASFEEWATGSTAVCSIGGVCPDHLSEIRQSIRSAMCLPGLDPWEPTR